MTRPHWIRDPPEPPIWLSLMVGWIIVAALILLPLVLHR